MDVYFLEAKFPIRKEYSKDSKGNLEKKSYPNIYEVTSHHEQPATLKDLEQLIQQYAAKGACLLKGELSRPLVCESRAGSTDRNAKTEWICLDLDGVTGYQDVDSMLADIGCGDTDYILQWSSSMGIENQKGFRCHVFMQLEDLSHPALLKLWLQHLNLSRQTLRNQLQLTKTNNALLWPLDVTTCQNDKMLFIAPPKLGKGVKNPYPKNQRIQFVAKKHRKLKLKERIPTRDAIQKETDKAVNQIRQAEGLPERRVTKFKFEGKVEYMANPDNATVTDIKVERGFVYLNLNGGDSWGYYHPEDNPGYIYNFKGEPVYRTQDLVPEYWASLAEQTTNMVPTKEGKIYLAFREFRSGMYYNGIYDGATDNLELAPAKSENQLKHFLKQYGQPIGDYIPDWGLVFDPHSDIVVDHDNKTVNTYVPSEYFKDPNPPAVSKIPPVCRRIISHVLGNDPQTFSHFINWLAVIVQHLDRTGTAWVLQGTQGTGKGLLAHKILSPLFGHHNTTHKRMEEIESDFTGYMENVFLTTIDEIEAGRSTFHSKITAKLKNLIVEPYISIRKMYQPPYMARNFNNMVFMSNDPAPVHIAGDDRRYNVAPYQDHKLKITTQEIDQIEQELPELYAYLKHTKANRDLAREPLANDARQRLVEISQTAIDEVSTALLTGDLEFFWDQLPSDQNPDLNAMGLKRFVFEKYRDLVYSLVENLPASITRDDLHTMFSWCVGNMPDSPNKFTALLKHHRIHTVPVWHDGRTTKGINVNWQVDKTWHNQVKSEIQAGSNLPPGSVVRLDSRGRH